MTVMSLSQANTRFKTWLPALTWGIGAALLHRVILTAWMVGIWLAVGQNFDASVDFHDPGGDLPAFATPEEELIFSVWRRWDAVHYLNLATYGYRASYPGPTVFGVLTPLGFQAFDAVLPGGIDLGAMAFETVAFALALIFLYRVVEVYYGDPELAPWAVAVLTLNPFTYVFGAPLSESIYLAMVLGLFYCAAKQYWGRAAFFGFMATLARSQGALLIGIAALIMLEQRLKHDTTWEQRIRYVLRHGWPLFIIPFAALGFTLWRQSIALPAMDQVYNEISYVFFVNPLQGVITNYSLLLQSLSSVLTIPDLTAMVVSPLLLLVMLRFPQHRRPALIAYTLGYMLVFHSKLNWQWGTDVVTFTQSFARYCIVLFPFAVLIADGLRRGGFWVRIGGAMLLVIGALTFSALNVLALIGP